MSHSTSPTSENQAARWTAFGTLCGLAAAAGYYGSTQMTHEGNKGAVQVVSGLVGVASAAVIGKVACEGLSDFCQMVSDFCNRPTNLTYLDVVLYTGGGAMAAGLVGGLSSWCVPTCLLVGGISGLFLGQMSGHSLVLAPPAPRRNRQKQNIQSQNVAPAQGYAPQAYVPLPPQQYADPQQYQQFAPQPAAALQWQQQYSFGAPPAAAPQWQQQQLAPPQAAASQWQQQQLAPPQAAAPQWQQSAARQGNMHTDSKRQSRMSGEGVAVTSAASAPVSSQPAQGTVWQRLVNFDASQPMNVAVFNSEDGPEKLFSFTSFRQLFDFVNPAFDDRVQCFIEGLEYRLEHGNQEDAKKIKGLLLKDKSISIITSMFPIVQDDGGYSKCLRDAFLALSNKLKQNSSK